LFDSWSNSFSLCFRRYAELVKIVKGVPKNTTLKAGDCFGQEVIVDQQKYAATVVSLQTTTGWKIDRAVLAKNVPIDKVLRSK
jgi:CRP-like cAMP-binding protein